MLRPIRFINPLRSPLRGEPPPVLLNQHKKTGQHTVLRTLLYQSVLINGFQNGVQNPGLIVLFTTKISGSAESLGTTWRSENDILIIEAST